ncbi:thermonuclease family protein, partial [Corynebacterium sp.]|uniref:thermonuclease family protein n=1 Tax=Corynebacterium sp. TaxID=1720 RepID=UPI0019A52C82
MLKGALITGVVVVGTVATVAVLSGEDPVTVIRVVDGDTIDARVDGKEKRIRLLNVDTPEYGRDGAADDCLAEEATAYLQSLLPSGREITLSYDSERTDRYGRDLAGVFVDDTLVNAEIAREGYGVAVQFGGNDRFMPEVSAAEAEAKAQRLGVHGLPDECLVSAQTATTVSEAAPLLAAGLLAMSQADLDLHEEKLLAALTKVKKVRTLALHPSEFAENAYDGHRAEQEELNDTAAKIEQRISEIGERRAQIEREAEEERQRLENERIEAERRAAEAAEAAEAA